MARRIAAAIALLALAVPCSGRTWTDTSGKFHTDAELVDFQNGQAYLQQAGGRIVAAATPEPESKPDPQPESKTESKPSAVVSAAIPDEGVKTADKLLRLSLDSERDTDGRTSLTDHNPPIHAIHPFGISSILLDYKILKMRKLPTPIDDPTLPPGKRTMRVRQRFEATRRAKRRRLSY